MPVASIRWRAVATIVSTLGLSPSAYAEVLIRWDLAEIPAASALGVSTVVVAAGNTAGIRNAIDQGYRVYLEVDGAAIATFRPATPHVTGVIVKGTVAAPQIAALERRLRNTGARLLVLDDRGKWPHIRTNWVARNNDVLQVTSRSAQPWIENNAAIFDILRSEGTGRRGLLTYRWTPVTIAAADEHPRLEDYLVAIAEAGSFGEGLLLPLHEGLQRDLLLGKPQARADWEQIRRHLAFYAWDLPARYRPLANIALVTGDPRQHFEVLNLLLRHNLPFDLIAPPQLRLGGLDAMDLLIVPGEPTDGVAGVLMDFARRGGIVVVVGGGAESPRRPDRPWSSEAPLTTSEDRRTYEIGSGRIIEMLQPVMNPDRFALEMRQVLGRERRLVDIWNGITVLARPYEDAEGQSLLITALNYAHQALPVQIRVRGTFTVVHHESPEQPLSLLPHTHRSDYTEFVVPSLHTGARVFLTERRATP